MKPRILIVVPKYASHPGEYYEFPLGLACINGALRNAGYDVSCLNLNHHEPPAAEQVASAVLDGQFNIVCSGGFSTHYALVKEIVDGAKKARPDIFTIIGGSLITSEPEIVAAGLGVTAGVIGEGEFTIVEIMQALQNSSSIESVPGTVTEINGKYSRTAPRNHIADLDPLPLPDYEGFDIPAYLDLQRPDDRQYLYPVDNPRFMYAVASRACPYSCSFCFPMFGKKIRKRSLDAFFQEVDMLVTKYDINILGVFDALFNTDKEFLEEFCRRMKPYSLKWLIQVRVDSLDEERLGILKDAGVFAILYGLESASDKTLKAMKKVSTVKQIESALALSRKMGVRILGEFIFGHPEETFETAMETLEWWKDHNFYQIDMGHVYPFPGCEDYRYCIDKGLIKDPLEYISTGCKPINMTSMTDVEYGSVISKIADYGHNHAIYGSIISIAKEKPSETKKAMAFTIVAECPHCGFQSVYNHYHIANFPGTIKYPFSCTTFTCRSCNQGFSVKEDEIFLKCPDKTAARQLLKKARK